ncbi:TraR/DksA family transcriptional regulator [Thalassococcus lentus]|uniref:TraR/DksA C4-type zinc finger protein n=1 Tax=Thalassococcus lentus TaxID=1210524 RepID=A0ABT4XRV0_9RHOB|nr:TraR/DksA C4-type zinc finger protein [Thalassococcus lentus]MDA7424661.1 TraR/DksA C4-type zinc finger protein [Thalassococcus lentus]
MDERVLHRFRDLIHQRMRALDEEDALGQEGQNTVTLDQQAIGRLSRQDALLSQSMAKATQARRDATRRALHAGLVRLDEGEFGYCDDCGEEIAIKRLELDPTASRCISCASG